MSDTGQHEEGLNAREFSKSKNRRHLLDSAAEAIFKHGFRGATIAAIQEISGLSRGMINLHFKTKENLLLAVAEDLSNSYSERWNKVALDPDLPAAEKLRRIIQLDLSPDFLNRRDVAVWFAFRSEVYSNPEYRKSIDSRDASLRDVMIELCQTLIDEGNYLDADAELATDGLIALLEGTWTDFHLHAEEFDRSKAERTCLYIAKSLFPDHF
ncbi:MULTISPECIES: TetR/AcrR family transcriptional regulator [unclassified Leisingera]|uniref:TetR/AcrR family transcriptional regulator n=1 Tax=unclassified Leisingera TaxID=2614906 RepID=UPI0002FC2FB8|nr:MULTISPECIES: TetR/AcrR family transcriptional regulator [unclassified Leisingera]KIC14111.1 TetR family transcriptional regulator [Leisingera sp. ANG-DT]KIC21087.1 TetR family transcriptional regulator [Leisingera sp. ANG-S3]KIC25837.1 TetR family transcriptional regulator [Leisingera sp. ANG-M6]KIC30531.1 TetR family transcriptional regulator [Leisingera sp. ANG-S5]KIC54012.1 TetR family transcriptional regulator [Leisingera sp. ANG-S]